MAEIVKMPRLSDTMTDGVVVKWHKKIGDKIEEGDLLADIETDKATMEFESFQEGYLLHIGVEEGNTAQVEHVLAILGDKNEDIKGLLNNSNSSKSTEEELVNNDIIVDSKQEIKPIKTNNLKPSDTDTSTNISESNSDKRLRISPLAKNMAKDRNLDISAILGTGDGGRIIKRDIENVNISTLPSSIGLDMESEDIPLSQMRKTIASRLSQSKFSAPHFYLGLDVNMDGLMEERKLMNNKNNTKISFNDIIVKAVSMAIKKHPIINSSWFETYIKLNKEINIGIAVSVENGLVVPVIKNADLKSFSEISEETKIFIEKAKNNKLQPQDWESNTFTISNLGMFGIDEFTAIINPPDACILAVGGIAEKPIVQDGKIVPGHVMRLTLSCDHRLVDGVEGSKFLNTLKNMLESPLMMFF